MEEEKKETVVICGECLNRYEEKAGHICPGHQKVNKSNFKKRADYKNIKKGYLETISFLGGKNFFGQVWRFILFSEKF